MIIKKLNESSIQSNLLLLIRISSVQIFTVLIFHHNNNNPYCFWDNWNKSIQIVMTIRVLHKGTISYIFPRRARASLIYLLYTSDNRFKAARKISRMYI